MTMPAVFAFCLAAAAHAQLAVPQDSLARLAEGRKSVQARLEPAKADAKAFEALVDRLWHEGAQVEEAQDPGWVLEGPALGPGAAPGDRVRAVLHGGMLAQRELGEPGSGFSDLALRYSFTRLEASEASTKELADKAIEVDSWHYGLGMDGSIYSAGRVVVVVSQGASGEVVIDQKRSKTVRLDPRDPAVAARWKSLEPKLLRLGRQTRI